INFVGHSVVRDLRNLLYSRIIEQSMAFFGKNPTGKLMSAVTSDIEKVQNAVSQGSADALRETFTLLFLMAVSLRVDWLLALMELLGAVTIAGLLLYARNQILHSAQTTGGFVAFVMRSSKCTSPSSG